jgi:transcription elongation factor Elf1
MTLIDDDPDYLSVAPDLSFRSRTRFQDETTGEWVSETEVVESAAELVELYNPADIYAAFAEAAREAAGLQPEPTAAEDLLSVAGIAQEESISPEADVAYAAAADDWAAGQPLDADDETSAAHKLYDLALTFQERSQLSEAHLIEQFQVAAGGLAEQVGDMIVIDDDDERLSLSRTGQIHAEVEPEGEEGEWRKLTTPEELVEFYDPTDVFGDIADAIAEAYPAVAPELDEEDDDEGEPDEDDDAEDDEPAGDAQPKADR